MKKLMLILVPLCLLVYSCTYNSIYINREQDNKEGKRFLNNFYLNVANKNYPGMDAMVSDSLRLLAGANGISQMVKFINGKMGVYKSYTIEDHYIRRIIGTNEEISYNYKLKVTYDKGIIDEIVGFKKQKGSTTINSYHANSDLLIK